MAGVAMAPMAHGQAADLIAKLKGGVTCSEPAAGNQLLRNADGSGASLNDILTALDEISIDASACIQVRDAASSLAQELNLDNPIPDADSVAAADERVQQILAEADRRAASMRFEVGPPPPRLTRNRRAPP